MLRSDKFYAGSVMPGHTMYATIIDLTQCGRKTKINYITLSYRFKKLNVIANHEITIQ